ncbi:carboxymuconolactone decarboxylase family protein [Halobacterium rubrum]|uniref:carboxymuconolactone decarboxylase family protein n=1 Tax=Halobacterium TaxID=2239 RepID=UPI001EED694E|nr:MULTISPECIES: peroxidase-related enzyme [Halobacterium]MDH5020323.1 peroxidase-related enzyme [Halobacterium rubrum]
MHLEYVTAADADEETAELLAADADQYGEPSLFARAVATNSDVLAARQRYHDAVVDAAGVDRRLAELVYLAVSVANDCEYCVASHREALVEQVGVPDADVDAVARGDTDAFDDRERAAIGFAEQVAADPSAVSAGDVDALRDAGFDDPAIVGLLAVAATAVSANTVADALNIRPGDRPNAPEQ